jgi:hypothetical protein
MRLLEQIYEARRYQELESPYWGTYLFHRLRGKVLRYPNFLDKPIRFWLGAYCIPVARTSEQNSQLKRLAIGRMVPTYALAQRVLVLDKEIQQLPAASFVLDLMAQLLVSTWRSRYWTHQEFTLANRRALVVQFQRPLGLEHLLWKARHLCRARYRRRRSILRNGDRSLYINELREISVVLLAQLTGLRMGEHRYAKIGYGLRKLFLGERKSENKGAPTYFCMVWSDFLGKTSSLPEDMLGILANILNLNPIDIARLPWRERMKAIFKSYRNLPARLLYTGPPLKPLESSNTCHSAQYVRHAEDRWIPRIPSDKDELYASGPLLPITGGFELPSEILEGLICIDDPPEHTWRSEGWYLSMKTRNSGTERA